MTSELRVRARAMQLERHEVVLELRAKDMKRDAEQKRMQCLLEIRKKEADIAKAAGRTAAAEARQKVAEIETNRRESKALMEAEAKAETALRLHYATFLAERLEKYMFDTEAGEERRRRVKADVDRAIAKRKGSARNPIPHLWTVDRSGLRNVIHPVGPARRVGKTDNLWASPAFCDMMFKGGVVGGAEVKFLFRRLVERFCPRYFDLFCAKYGLDSLIAEAERVLDLAFVAAVWRYTVVIGKERYRVGVDTWPPREDWSHAVIVPQSIAPPAQDATASSASARCIRGAEPSAEPSTTAASAASAFTSV